MPCDILNTLKNSCHAVFGIKFFNNILSSTLSTSLVITITILLLVVIIIPLNNKLNSSIIFKFIIYTYLTTTIILFLHSGTLKIHQENKSANQDELRLINTLDGADINITDINNPDKIKVYPQVGSDGSLNPTISNDGVYGGDDHDSFFKKFGL